MSSHDAHVLAGRVGSETRTKKINMMLNEIDERVAEARKHESSEIENIRITSAHLATKLNFSQSTICRNGFPEFFEKYFESIKYFENKGLVIKIEEFVEERKEQREKIAELKSDNK